MANDRVVAKATYFTVKVPSRPHVTAEEGGHLFVEVNDPAISDRTQLSPEAAIECMWLTMLAGAAMEQVLRERGLDIYRLNYQDNGNWSFLRGEAPRMHVHIYGRTRNETFQQYGQALYFPDPGDERYNLFAPFDEATARAIGDRMRQLASTPQFAWYEGPAPLVFA